MFNNDKERKERNAKTETASVWTEIFSDLQPYLNVYYDPKSAKILEPNYSYYNIKLWTALFMENNIYLENKHFSVNDAEKNITFKSKQEFFAYKKKEDENKYMNYQLKYDELFKAMAESYYFIKDEKNIFDNLSLESKNLINSLKNEMDKINKNRLMRKEIVDKSLIKKEEKNKIPIKDETQKLKMPNLKEAPKKEIKDVNKPKDEPNKEKKEEIKEEKKQEIKEEKKEENTVEEKKEESSEEKKEEEKVEEKKEENSEEKAEEKKDENSGDKKEEAKEEEKNDEKKEEDSKEKEKESSDINNEKKEEIKPEENKEDDNNKEIEKNEGEEAEKKEE